ncbi:hypothetical protein [Methanococcoides sp. FTZ1]|uniref:hypothetical protein n=1 Tax=Methanococcoides sp. FTZ1 TaxID=3439061 RepID=UPI003F86A173
MNILAFFDMDSVRRDWPGPIDLFNVGCIATLMEHVVPEVAVPDENGIIHNYGIEWLDG